MADPLETEIAKIVDEGTAEVPANVMPRAEMPRTAQFKQVGEPPLLDQVMRMEQIGVQLKNRVRREQLAMQHDFEMNMVSVRNAYERKIHDAITTLEKQRDAELQQLNDQHNAKSRECELIAKRMGI